MWGCALRVLVSLTGIPVYSKREKIFCIELLLDYKISSGIKVLYFWIKTVFRPFQQKTAESAVLGHNKLLETLSLLPLHFLTRLSLPRKKRKEAL